MTVILGPPDLSCTTSPIENLVWSDMLVSVMALASRFGYSDGVAYVVSKAAIENDFDEFMR